VTRRRSLAMLGATLVVIAAWVVPGALAAGGTLSISPAIIEHVATPGPVGTVTITNTTSTAMRIAVDPRPWIQSRSGAVSPDRRRTLSGVRLSASSFVLGAGGRASVVVTLLHEPSGGSAYGSVEVIGIPVAQTKGTGAILGYRLISTLRLDSPSSARRIRLVVGKAAERDGAATVAIRNAGNTIDAISGRVTIRGGTGVKRASIAAVRVLPGDTVGVRIGRVAGLPRGAYTVTIELRQAASTVVVRRKLHVR
jgi:hypothetical protein